MGQLLSHPIEEKKLEFRTMQTVSYCIGLMQGYRMSMEDAHSVRISDDERVAVFGVFDGHGGKECAEKISESLSRIVFDELVKMSQCQSQSQGLALALGLAQALTQTLGVGQTLSQGLSQGPYGLSGHKATPGPVPRPGPTVSAYMRAIKDAFFKADHELPRRAAANSGSTAIVACIIAKRFVIVANTGDSRCIMSLEGGAPKTLSFDHKPSILGERVRIENSGGYVVSGRVNEVLALSRAFGDSKFKIPFVEAAGNQNKYIAQQARLGKNGGLVELPPELWPVTVEPDLLVYDLQQLREPEFMVLACDGIWDCYTSGHLVKVVRHKLSLGWLLQHICEFILNDCIGMASNVTGIGFDNMTIIIIAIHSNGTLEQWSSTMKARVLKEKKLRD